MLMHIGDFCEREGTSVATWDEEGDVSAEGEDGIMSPSPSIFFFFFFPSGDDTVRWHAALKCGSSVWQTAGERDRVLLSD